MDSITATEHYDPRHDLLNKKELIDIIIAQKNEIVSLNEDLKKMTNLRLCHLERNHYMYIQYGRRGIWKKGHMEEGAYGRRDIWKKGHMEEGTYGRRDIWKKGHMEEGTYGRRDIWKKGHMEEGTYGRRDIWKKGHMEEGTYGRRDSVDIFGIPQDVKDERLEGVIDKLKEAEVWEINRQSPKKMDIQAAHRLKIVM